MSVIVMAIDPAFKVSLERARDNYAEEFPVMAFMVKAGDSWDWWLLNDEGMTTLTVEFPGLTDERLIEELNKAHRWVHRIPSNRKTSSGMMKFLRRWLTGKENSE